MLRAIWYDLCNLKNVNSTHGGELLLVRLHVEVCNFIKSNIPPLVFSRFLICAKGTKLRKASQDFRFQAILTQKPMLKFNDKYTCG